MRKTFIVLIGGLCLGVIATLAGLRLLYTENPDAGEVVREILKVDATPVYTSGQSATDRYAGIRLYEDVLAQPSAFARNEALHVLAARADEPGIRTLIDAASETTDEFARVNYLEILFFRFAEIDPRAAVDLARTDEFAVDKSLEDAVWRTWARADLDDAIFAVNTESSYTRRLSAAESLVKAFGYLGNETTERIEQETGLKPSRTTRARYLYLLADRSPAEAIAFINDIADRDQQYEYVSWLGHYLAGRDPDLALTYSNQFTSEQAGNSYRTIIGREMARENPHATLDKLLADESSENWRSEFHSAIAALVKTDLEASVQYMERIRSTDLRRQFASAIAREMAKDDPETALAWARDNDRHDYPQVVMTVLHEIARTDPGRAIAEAQNVPGSAYSRFLMPNLMRQIARENPEEAVAYLEQIRNPNSRAEAAESLLSSWVERDAEAAVDWALDKGKEYSAGLLLSTAERLVKQDIDAAIRMLPRFDEVSKSRLQQEIAQNLALNRTPAEAIAFVRQFEGQPGFANLQSALIMGVIHNDLYLATQLADQMSAGDARDRAYVQIIGKRAEADPADALSWVHNISDAEQRGAAVGQVVQRWHGQDPESAERWALGIPAGTTRDNAIMNMSMQWRSVDDERMALIESIEDPEKRGNAKMSQVFRLIRTDPLAAQKLLDDDDIPELQKNRAREYLNRTLAN